ncbi:MAG: hypothetical protein ACXVZK_09285 [Gaiellaceae bacterium]
MQTERETRVGAGTQIAPRLPGVEGAALDEHVCGFRDSGGIREHLRQDEVEVGIRVVVLGRHCVCPEPRGDPALVSDRLQRVELGVAVEAVAGLRLERRRPRAQHPAAVCAHGGGELFGTGCARRPDGGHDSASRGVELLVRRTGRAERELLHAVAGKAGVRVAVDEPGDRAEPAPVDLLHLAVEPRKVAHAADALDRSAGTEDVRVFDHVDLDELTSP